MSGALTTRYAVSTQVHKILPMPQNTAYAVKYTTEILKYTNYYLCRVYSSTQSTASLCTLQTEATLSLPFLCTLRLANKNDTGILYSPFSAPHKQKRYAQQCAQPAF